MTLDRVWLLDRFYNPNREALGVGAILHGAHENAKFIATKARHHVGGVDTLTQPRRDAHQKLVSDGMTKCVVHFLEAIEIDVQQGQRAALLVDLRQIALEFQFWNCKRLGRLVNMSKWAMCSISRAAWRCSVTSSITVTKTPASAGSHRKSKMRAPIC